MRLRSSLLSRSLGIFLQISLRRPSYWQWWSDQTRSAFVLRSLQWSYFATDLDQADLPSQGDRRYLNAAAGLRAGGLLGCLLQDDLRRIRWIGLERVFSQKYVFAVQTLERPDIAKNPRKRPLSGDPNAIALRT